MLAPFLGHLIIQQHFHLSLALFMLAGATDLVRIVLPQSTVVCVVVCFGVFFQCRADTLRWVHFHVMRLANIVPISPKAALKHDAPSELISWLFRFLFIFVLPLNNYFIKFNFFFNSFFTQLDGYIARTWPTQKSALGSALDPLADKILISILYISLTYAELIPGTGLWT